MNEWMKKTINKEVDGKKVTEEIKEIQNLPCLMGYAALKAFQKETGIKISGIQYVLEDFELTEKLLYHSLRYGHIEENKEFTLKIEDMEKLFSNNESHVYAQFIEIYTNSIGKLFIKEDRKETKKK